MSNKRRSRPYLYGWAHLIATLIVFAVIMLQIWHGYPQKPTFVFFLALFALTGSINYFSGDRIGLWPKSGEQIFGFMVIVFYLGMFIFFINGAEVDTALKLGLDLGRGIGWALGQQYLLNGFFVNRLAAFYGDENNKNVPWLTALLFAGVHAPNWFLMAATFIGGYACVKVFLKEHNLYLLGLAHMIVGFLVLRLVPESITGSFQIGPHYL